jgi:hypothetical protein
MMEDAPFLPGLSAVAGKPVHLAFDGGRLTSDAGVLVLAEIERRLGISERLARCIEDPRAAERVRHGLAEMIRFRALMIAAGYPDANDCDALRNDPAFKMATGRLPETDEELCSQPTMCRLENLPSATALKRMMAAMVELFCDSFAEVPLRIVLDVDDTEDRVHGHQQLSLFHAHYDSRCFLPIHIYEAGSGKPVAVILRPGKTPGGAEVARVLRHLVRAIRGHWPRVEILIRGDSHYARPEALTWLERNRVGYIFGLAGNKTLFAKVAALIEDVAVSRAEDQAGKVRRYGEFRYAARTWDVERQVIARIEASPQGSDSRFVITNIQGAPRWLYEDVYCARGQAENLMYGRLPPCKHDLRRFCMTFSAAPMYSACGPAVASMRFAIGPRLSSRAQSSAVFSGSTDPGPTGHVIVAKITTAAREIDDLGVTSSALPKETFMPVL